MDKEEQLAILHDATGLDVDTCRMILDSAEWDLQQGMTLALDLMADKEPPNIEVKMKGLNIEEAVEAHTPTNSYSMVPPTPTENLKIDYNTQDGPHILSSLPDKDSVNAGEDERLSYEGPIKLSDSLATIDLHVQWCDEDICINLLPTQTVGELKQLLSKQTNLPPEKLVLISTFIVDPADDVTIKSLNIPGSDKLILVSTEDDDVPSKALSEEGEGEGEGVDLADELYSDTDSSDTFSNEESDMSDMDDYEAPPSVPISERQALRKPLIPQDPMSVLEATRMFSNRFKARYGPSTRTLIFKEGTLLDAVSEAKKQGLPLLVYIHSDSSIETNIFCQGTLCDPRVVKLLNDNFVCWGWDVTFHCNFEILQTISLNTNLPLSFQKSQPECPLTVVVLFGDDTQGPTCTEIGFEGAVGYLEQIIPILRSNASMLESARVLAETRERQRREREAVQLEQDLAYKESLHLDRKKTIMLAEQQKKEREAREKEEERNRELLLQLEQRERENKAVVDTHKALVVSEPPADSTEQTCTLRFRLPDGSSQSRRFLVEKHLLQDLHTYLGSLGYPPELYDLVLHYPKRTMASTFTQTTTIKDMKLSLRETVFVVEK